MAGDICNVLVFGVRWDVWIGLVYGFDWVVCGYRFTAWEHISLVCWLYLGCLGFLFVWDYRLRILIGSGALFGLFCLLVLGDIGLIYFHLSFFSAASTEAFSFSISFSFL